MCVCVCYIPALFFLGMTEVKGQSLTTSVSDVIGGPDFPFCCIPKPVETVSVAVC